MIGQGKRFSSLPVEIRDAITAVRGALVAVGLPWEAACRALQRGLASSLGVPESDLVVTRTDPPLGGDCASGRRLQGRHGRRLQTSLEASAVAGRARSRVGGGLGSGLEEWEENEF